MNNAAPRIVSFEVMGDASGAPAVVAMGPFRFSFDVLGEVRSNALGAPATRRDGRIALARCTALYRRELAARTDAAWLAANVALYAAEAAS